MRIFRNFLRTIYYSKRLILKDNLIELFKFYGSDKYVNHLSMYKILESLLNKNDCKKILEIGIGGHAIEDENFSGNSMRALKKYYKCDVIGLDIVDKNFLSNEFFIYTGKQTDKKILNKIINDHKKFDLIIDDGSHFGSDQVLTFNHLFKFLSQNGIYIIEDLDGAFTNKFKGSPKLEKSKNIIALTNEKVFSVYSQFITYKMYKKKKLSNDIDSIFFFNNSVLIKKSKPKKKIRDKYLKETLSQFNKRYYRKGKVNKNVDGTITFNFHRD
jgi:hypothetical protein